MCEDDLQVKIKNDWKREEVCVCVCGCEKQKVIQAHWHTAMWERVRKKARVFGRKNATVSKNHTWLHFPLVWTCSAVQSVSDGHKPWSRWDVTGNFLRRAKRALNVFTSVLHWLKWKKDDYGFKKAFHIIGAYVHIQSLVGLTACIQSANCCMCMWQMEREWEVERGEACLASCQHGHPTYWVIINSQVMFVLHESSQTKRKKNL